MKILAKNMKPLFKSHTAKMREKSTYRMWQRNRDFGEQKLYTDSIKIFDQRKDDAL